MKKNGLVGMENLAQFLCFLSLTMSLVSLWIKKHPILWGGFLVCSLVFGWMSQVIGMDGIIAVAILGVLIWFLKHLEGLGRTILVFIVFVVSLAFWMHKIPGFFNWKVMDGIIGQGTISYRLWLNYDKPLPALFLLAWVVPIHSGWPSFRKMLVQTLPWMIMGIVLLVFLALKGNLVRWDPKLPQVAPFFLWANLFFVSIPEEVLLRGFLQKELCKLLGNKVAAQILSVILVAFLFALMHLGITQNWYYLLMVFIAGLFFGGVYQYTKAIESSILCHYLFNVTHFFLFSYPMLAP